MNEISKPSILDNDIFKDAKTFRGIEGSKRGEIKVDVDIDTGAAYIEELDRCLDDIIYFAEKYYTITTIDEGKKKIKPYPKQVELLKALQEELRVVVLATRQVGKTTAYCIFALWYCCFNRDKKVLLLAHEKQTAEDFLTKMKTAYENMPGWIKPGIKRWKGDRIIFANDCEIEVLEVNEKTGRGLTANIIILDEFAFVNRMLQQKVWTALQPALSSGKSAKLIVVSTPNGTGDLYHELVLEGERPDSLWHKVFIHWTDVPGRDQQWVKLTKDSLKGTNKDLQWRQEYEAEFITLNNIIIDPDMINKLKTYHENAKEEANKVKPWFKHEINGFKVNIYKEPDARRMYGAAVDTAAGDGGDDSVCKIFDITYPAEIIEVASFHSNLIKPTPFAALCAELLSTYFNPIAIIENNGIGASTVSLLETVFEYENIVDWGTRKSTASGFSSNPKSKAYICMFFQEYVTHPNMKLTLGEWSTLGQLEYFEKVETERGFTYKASPGMHDDHVMATIMGVFSINNEISQSYANTITKFEGDLIPSSILPFDNPQTRISNRSKDLKRIRELSKMVVDREQFSFIGSIQLDEHYAGNGLDIDDNSGINSDRTKTHDSDEYSGGSNFYDY